MDNRVYFTKTDTDMLKGVGLLLMIFDHLFWNLEYTGNLYQTLFLPKSIMSMLGNLCGVCVQIFIFLSAYGITCTYNKKKISTFTFTLRNIVKLFLNFAFVFIVAVLIGIPLHKVSFVETWEGNIFALIADFLGLAYLFHLPSINDTWWYVSLTYILYIIFPIFNKLCKKNILLFIGILFIVNFFPFYPSSIIRTDILYRNVLSFGLGITFANYNLFSYISEKKCTNIIASVVLLVASLILIIDFNTDCYPFFSFSIIYFVYLLLGNIEVLKNVLCIIGQHSATGYFLHNFILYKYFQKITFSFRYPILIFLFVSISTFATSFIIDFIKNRTGYDKICNGLFTQFEKLKSKRIKS